ncbi:unnamed protein product [Protopolystoma xenopodis]|uniref:Uncharacterized protein n=1 Tax=Protopolystoma xenopodis TaxID=117903 RepID=A0A448WSY8_9PLAT|nr:unnamed protein product [Protopolystoma xenopodis]
MFAGQLHPAPSHSHSTSHRLTSPRFSPSTSHLPTCSPLDRSSSLFWLPTSKLIRTTSHPLSLFAPDMPTKSASPGRTAQAAGKV